MILSILLATYNGEKYLPKQLDSLMSQTYTDFKVYISDDCSKDNTKQIIAEYISKYPERIIDINNKKHFGNARDNFLNLVEKIDSDIYMFCDQDDVWLPTKVEKTVAVYNAIENKHLPILVHSDLVVVDENLKEINHSFFNIMQLQKNLTDWRSFVVQNYVTGCTMLINRPLAQLYKSNANLLCKDSILMHDYFFALLAALLGKIIFIDESLMLYRQHGNNSVGAKNVNSLNYAFSKLKKSKKNINVNIQSEKQIAEVIKVLDSINYMGTENKILTEYSFLYKKNKFSRIAFIYKNKLCKIGLKRKVFQLLTI